MKPQFTCRINSFFYHRVHYFLATVSYKSVRRCLEVGICALTFSFNVISTKKIWGNKKKGNLMNTFSLLFTLLCIQFMHVSSHRKDVHQANKCKS